MVSITLPSTKPKPKFRNIKNLTLHLPSATDHTYINNHLSVPTPTTVQVTLPHPRSSEKHIRARSNAQRGEWTKVILHRERKKAEAGFLSPLLQIQGLFKPKGPKKEKYIPPLSHRLREKRMKFKRGPMVQGSLRDIRRRRRVLEGMMVMSNGIGL